MGRDRRDPVDQDGVVRDSGYKPQEKRLGWLFIDDDEEERDEGDPGEERESEFRDRDSCEHPGQYRKDEICFFEFQITGLCVESCTPVSWRRKEKQASRDSAFDHEVVNLPS